VDECQSLLGGGAGTNSTPPANSSNTSNTSSASAASARRIPRRSLRRALLQALPLPTDVSLDSAVGGVFLGVDSWQVLTAAHSSISHLNLCSFCQ